MKPKNTIMGCHKLPTYVTYRNIFLVRTFSIQLKHWERLCNYCWQALLTFQTHIQGFISLFLLSNTSHMRLFFEAPGLLFPLVTRRRFMVSVIWCQKRRCQRQHLCCINDLLIGPLVIIVYNWNHWVVPRQRLTLKDEIKEDIEAFFCSTAPIWTCKAHFALYFPFDS